MSHGIQRHLASTAAMDPNAIRRRSSSRWRSCSTYNTIANHRILQRAHSTISLCSNGVSRYPCFQSLQYLSYRTFSIDYQARYNEERLSYIKHVESSTEKWAKKYIIDYDICPFAKESKYRIVVWHGDDVTGSSTDGMNVTDFVENEMNLLLQQLEESPNNANRPSTMIVFPFVDELVDEALLLNSFCISIAEAIPGAGDRSDSDNPSCRVQIVPFHRDADWSFKSPWPTLHLVPMSELKKVRKGGDEVSVMISQKNNTTLASERTQRELTDILIESFTGKKPDPIQVIGDYFDSEQQASYEEKGYQIVKLADTKDATAAVASIKKIPKKGRAGKGKKKNR